MCTFVLYVISLVSGCPNLPSQLLSVSHFYCTAVPWVVHRVAAVSDGQSGETVLLLIPWLECNYVHVYASCSFVAWYTRFVMHLHYCCEIRGVHSIVVEDSVLGCFLCWLHAALWAAWSWRWRHHNPSNCQDQHRINIRQSVSPRRSRSWPAGMWRSVPTFWRNLQPLSSGNKRHISEDHSHNMHCHENLESHVYGTCCYLSFYHMW